MEHPRRLSLVQITAEHLREGFRRGRWSGLLPGVRTLARELEVSKDTVRDALRQLEADGSLQPQGSGKCRKIHAPRDGIGGRARLRVAVLVPLPLHEDNTHSQRLILELRAAIEVEKHDAVIVHQPVSSTAGSHLRRLARLVAETAADAWIIYSASHEVLKWFAEQPLPALALGGHARGLALASTRTDLAQAMDNCVDELVRYGHRRIVLIAPEWWRKPAPNFAAQAFLARLSHHGLPSSEYNLPEWQESPEGLENLMQALLFATPPTTLLLGEPTYCSAIRAWLGEHDRHVPRDVSIVNLMPDPLFQMHRLTYASFNWPEHVHHHRILRWLKNLLAGRPDQEQFIAHAAFTSGGTIGPVKSA